jgi:hypothetical protein
MTGAAAVVMARISGVMFAFLCATACVAEEELDDGTRALSDNARVDDVDTFAPAEEPDVCDLLPECGPCSMACDPDALAELIPAGTCAAFLCELVDGRRVTFHACHH